MFPALFQMAENWPAASHEAHANVSSVTTAPLTNDQRWLRGLARTLPRARSGQKQQHEPYTTTAPTSPAGRKLNMLLNRLDSAVNRGIVRIDDAYYGAPVIAS